MALDGERDIFTQIGILDERTKNLNKVTQEIKIDMCKLDERISDNHIAVNKKMEDGFLNVNTKIDAGFKEIREVITPINDERNKAKGALKFSYILLGLALTILGLVIAYD